MSQTFTLISRSSELTATYYPPIELDTRYEYALGLIGLHTYNTIPNIYEGKNKFYYANNQVITIPTGAYEITDIEACLRDSLSTKITNAPKDKLLTLKANNNTLKCEILSGVPIDFSKDDSIGEMLGFSKKKLKANVKHESDIPIQIIKVVTIRVECNITTSAFHGERLSHTLYEFAPSVQPGYSINIEPKNIIYLPINTSHVDNIRLRLLDQDGDLVNFRGEKIVIILELKKYGSGI